MTLRTHLAVACVALPAMVAVILMVEDHESATAPSASVRSAIAPVASSRTIEAERHRAVAGPPPTDEAVTTTYAALRDDINPKPRLQLIDAWARAAPATAPLDLLSSAMVDPDESVRARAQELFDRRLEEHRTAPRTDR